MATYNFSFEESQSDEAHKSWVKRIWDMLVRFFKRMKEMFFGKKQEIDAKQSAADKAADDEMTRFTEKAKKAADEVIKSYEKTNDKQEPPKPVGLTPWQYYTHPAVAKAGGKQMVIEALRPLFEETNPAKFGYYFSQLKTKCFDALNFTEAMKQLGNLTNIVFRYSKNYSQLAPAIAFAENFNNAVSNLTKGKDSNNQDLSGDPDKVLTGGDWSGDALRRALENIPKTNKILARAGVNSNFELLVKEPDTSKIGPGEVKAWKDAIGALTLLIMSIERMQTFIKSALLAITTNTLEIHYKLDAIHKQLLQKNQNNPALLKELVSIFVL